MHACMIKIGYTLPESQVNATYMHGQRHTTLTLIQIYYIFLCLEFLLPTTLFTKRFWRRFVWQARQALYIFLMVTKIFSWIKWQSLKLFFVSSVTCQPPQLAEETTSSWVLTHYWYDKCHQISSDETKLIQRATFKRQLHTYPAHMKNIPAEKHLHLEHLFEWQQTEVCGVSFTRGEKWSSNSM